MKHAIILGQAPSRTSREPLDGRCGARLAELAGLPGYDDLTLYFAVGNLLGRYPGRRGDKGDLFDMARARAAAAGFLEEHADEFDFVVLLGRKVAAAFGVGNIPYLRWQRRSSPFIATLPHPSGVNHWWNERANVTRARRFMRRLVRELEP